jgi:cytochrome c peroxidase
MRQATADPLDELPNNFPFLNQAGTAATFSTAGTVNLGNAFHVPQGNNGRSCESCHLVQSGWSIRPADVELRFLLTRGMDPIFNLLDANSPNADVSTPQARRAAYSMLRNGLFRRGGPVPAGAEYEITAVDDPLGATAGIPARFQVFRRPLATANFHIAKNVGWHDQDTNGSGDVHAGLISQATNNVLGAQQGSPDPLAIATIVEYEESLRFAQQFVFGVGLLTTCGAQGGPENLSTQPPVRGRFTLYDAWIGLIPGSCTTRSADRQRAQIARGQELFNATNPGGRSCNGCHNAANNGSNISSNNVSGTLFDVGASRPEFRKPGMPLYTLRNTKTFETRQTTDPGRALRSGLWIDVDRFKTPSLRGVAARAPYFHNGIAPTLRDVVLHYETTLGFVFTAQERDDLVAFLEAL